jgi:hypothetical protein
MNIGEEEIIFFSKVPGTLDIYESVKERIIRSIEGTSVKIQKTQVCFLTGKNFAYVWLPIRKVKNRPETYIILTFVLNRRIVSTRIEEAAEPYRNRWTHHIIVKDGFDFDEEVIRWLIEAEKFANRKMREGK